jgi:hypothetical protein
VKKVEHVEKMKSKEATEGGGWIHVMAHCMMKGGICREKERRGEMREKERMSGEERRVWE